jgi:hypothetical protein
MTSGENKKTNNFLKAIGFAAGASLVLFLAFAALEPSLVGAAFDTDDVLVNLSVGSTISLNSPSDVNMGTITGTGSVTGNTTWTVTTNNSSGWKLELEAKSSTAPAMTSGSDTFDDYGEAVEGTPETWSMANSVSEFGFGATGSFIETKFGANKYMGFNYPTPKEQVSHGSAETAGDDTTVIFRADVGSAKSQPTGNYSATVTATATTL